MELEFTKEEFRAMMDKNQIDIRPMDICFFNNCKYIVKTDNNKNSVVLTPIS